MRFTSESAIVFDTTDGPVQKQGMFGGRYLRQSFEELRFKLAEDPFEQNIFTVIRWTNPPLDSAPARRLGGKNFCQPISFGARQTVLELTAIARIVQTRRNIVEQNGEGAHPSLVEALSFAQKRATARSSPKRNPSPG